MKRTDDVRRRAKLLPAARADRPLPLLGAHGDRQRLARLTFGKFKIPLSPDELTGLARRAEAHLHAKGTLFGFVRGLLLGGGADVR